MYLRTKLLHDPLFGAIFELLSGTCGGGILILREKNLSKHCLLRFFSLNIKNIFTAYAVKHFKDCNIKFDNREFLSSSIYNYTFASKVSMDRHTTPRTAAMDPIR